MSRIAKSPINLPAGVEVKIDGQVVTVKGAKGSLTQEFNALVQIALAENVLTFAPAAGGKQANAQAGTARSIVNNMVQGVSEGFSKKLILNGVGYRAKAAGSTVNLSLGFSHPIDYVVPEGVKVETPAITEIVLSGCNKQQIGQIAAEIRAFRPPEPYKGKGVRYADEHVRRKEAKKK